ncbi:uncharacterized protein ACMZJ9_007441 [Mantella aurantiaca]
MFRQKRNLELQRINIWQVKMGCAILTLLCLWSCIMAVTPLTHQQVHKATQYIKTTFNLAETRQYAYVAVFTQQECDSLSSENIDLKILQRENAGEIADALNHDENIYEGNQMVLATFRVMPGNQHSIHSEYRLLHSPGNKNSPVHLLLNKNPKAACVLFYSLNSPCVGVCTNLQNVNNIIGELPVFDIFNNNNKAFVYSKLYTGDIVSNKITKEDIWAGLAKINNKMEVFHCFDRQCYKCFEKISNTLKYKQYCLN